MKRLMLLLVIAISAAPSLTKAVSCDDGGFTLLGLAGDQDTIVPASSLPGSFLVKGKYVEFTVDSATFGVRDWTLTGAPSTLDITGGRRTVVFASKMPDHRGLTLTSGVSVRMSRESLVISRDGPGLFMKIQVKDCASGGLFQMEIERADQAATVFTHILADGVFYFDNPNVRDRLGERIPCSGILPDGTPVVCNGANDDGTVTVTARVNFGNELSDKFVGRDSPQVATRIAHDCVNNIPNPFHPGTVNHCGGISQWSVASGGRMGQVMGEDSTEIAPAATVCTENCTAQNHVNGRALVVGFPFPVPTAVRLQPRFNAPAPASEAINLSTRLRVQTGDNVGIGGFIITGSSPKHVLIRAIGPSLTGFGVPNVLADPVLELHGPGAFAPITNDNWRANQEAEIQATGIPPTNDFESAIDVTLTPGTYTAIVRGNGNTSGIALVEVYDLNQAVDSKLANLSTRAFVSTGDNVVIAGFMLGSNSGDDRIVVRGIGPSLTAAGVPNALADPTLELRDTNGTLLVANNDWQDNPGPAAEITAASLAPTNNLESAIVATLPPGPYTALLSGTNNGTGIGVVEVYDRGGP